MRLPADAGALIFVALTWAAQTYLLMGFITDHSVNVPYYDEWEMIPALTGYQPITLEWLWSQHNEHRIVLPRLAYLMVEKVGHYDFRAGVFFDGVLLSGLSVAFCAAVRTMRGQSRYSDAFFPLLLLHWGQAENLSSSFQIAFVLGAAIYMVALLSAAIQDESRPARAFVLAGCALALTLVGGHGIALVPSLALCGVLAAQRLRIAGQPWRVYAPVGGLALFSLALVPLYFVGYMRPEKHPVTKATWDTLRGALQFLAGSFGSGHKPYWPLGGYVFAFAALPCVGTLCACAWRQPEKRLRALSLLLFLGGVTGLALGIGWSRSVYYGGSLFASRYVTLALPFLCAVYLAWELCGPPRWRDFMQFFLFAALAVMVIRNRDDGFGDMPHLDAIRQDFRRDIDSHMSMRLLASKHCANMYYVCEGSVFLDRLNMLRARGVRGFAELPD